MNDESVILISDEHVIVENENVKVKSPEKIPDHLRQQLQYDFSNPKVAKKMIFSTSKSNPFKLHNSGNNTYTNDTISIEEEFNEKEVVGMDNQTKDYVDQRISSMEKLLDQKFKYQQNIISEKLDHLNTRTEKNISDNFYKLKEELEKNKKEDRRYLVGTAIAIVAVIVTLLGYVF